MITMNLRQNILQIGFSRCYQYRAIMEFDYGPNDP
jgi:hypothetical protein